MVFLNLRAWRVFKKSIFLVLIFSICRAAFADWDNQVSFGARTAPFGGTLSGTLGYGINLWGEDPTPNLPENGPPIGNVPNWKFGYIRPSLNIQTIGYTSRSQLELDLFPISIVGLTIGQAFHYRFSRASQFDCTTVNCDGYLNRFYVRAQAIAGVADAALMVWAQYNWVSTPNPLPMLEETSALLGVQNYDQLASVTAMAMYKIQDQFLIGVLASQQKFINSGTSGFTSLVYANYFKNKFGFFLGVGTYSSTHASLTPTVYGQVQLMGKRPMGWF